MNPSERNSHPSPIRAAIYARVSTANSGQDPSMQTRELREYCERRRWQVVGEYVDLGFREPERSAQSLIDSWQTLTDGGSMRLWFGDSIDSLDRCRICCGRSNTFKRWASSSSHYPKTLIRAHRLAKWCSRCWVLWPSWSGASLPSGYGQGCGMRGPKVSDWVVLGSMWISRGLIICARRVAHGQRLRLRWALEKEP